jgi:hypothetical protein
MIEVISTLAVVSTLLIAALMMASAFLPSKQPVLRPVRVRQDARSAKRRG